MKNHPELIVMLTYNDRTVENAYEVFEQCKDSKATFWGFKEKGIPLKQMKKLYTYMKDCGKTTCLEIVAYTEAECLEGAQMAVECGCDILMGTCYFESVNALCKQHHLKYMPFVGEVTCRPSVLAGSAEDMVVQAHSYMEKEVYGFDLLGYRYTGEPAALNREFVARVSLPTCIAGSINSFARLDEVKEAGPELFTIGSAFFDEKFGGTFREQIDKVCDYMEQ